MVFPFRLMRVSGHSMQPALNAGDLVLVDSQAFRKRLPNPGEVVAARPLACEGRAVVKRLHPSLEKGEYFLAGDCPQESTDSRHFGPITFEELLGPVTWRVWPWGRLSR